MIRTSFLSLAIAAALVSPAAADGMKPLTVRTDHTNGRLTSNPVVGGAQDTGRAWVSAVCGSNECLNDRWRTKNRIRAMRPTVHGGTSRGSYLAR